MMPWEALLESRRSSIGFDMGNLGQALSAAQRQLHQREQRESQRLPRGHSLQQALDAAARQEQQASQALRRAQRALGGPDRQASCVQRNA